MQDFEQLEEQNFGRVLEDEQSGQELVTKIVERLLVENRLKFLQIIRNLNARYEYANVAQYLMMEILPGIDAY